MAKRGAKTKLTEETRERILGMVRAGNYRETAAAAAGIASRTLREWMLLGAKGVSPFATFALAMDKAEAEAEARGMTQIAKAEGQDWKAAAWRLERRYPERYAAHTVVHTKMQAQIDELLKVLQSRLPENVYDMVTSAVAAHLAGEVGAVDQDG